MKKLLYFAGLIIMMIVCAASCKKEPIPEPIEPIQVTGEIIVVESSVAKIGGTVSAAVREVGACWDTLENPSVAKNKATGIQGGNGNFSVYLSKLVPNKQYFVKTFALDNNGSYVYSPELSLKTELLPPTATTLAASSMGLNQAMLNGKIFLPKDTALSWWFDYGETTSYGIKTPEQGLFRGGSFNVNSQITGLAASKTYHFKFNMRIKDQVFSGSDQSFTTLGNKPSIVSLTTDNEQLDKIIITAIINPNLLATTVSIEWYDGTNLESLTLSQVLEGGSDIEISKEITVSRAQEYAISLKATNVLGQTTKDTSVISLALIDMHGNKFHACKIGNQYWLTANWRALNYNNGDPIPNITEPVAWGEQTQGALCFFDNDQENYQIYGPLYNWYVISDPRGICPPGWHVPTWDELYALHEFICENCGGGGSLKEAGLEHWYPENAYGTNSTGFTALPEGVRGSPVADPTPEEKGTFMGLHTISYFWTSDSCPDPTSAWLAFMMGDNGGLWIAQGGPKYYGESLRLIKN